ATARGCAHLAAPLRIDAGPPPEAKVPTTGMQIPAGRNEGLSDQRDESLRGRRRRVEVPRSEVGILQDHPPARGDEPKIARELVGGPPQRPDLESAMHEIESVWLESAVEQVVLHERDVPETVLLDQ